MCSWALLQLHFVLSDVSTKETQVSHAPCSAAKMITKYATSRDVVVLTNDTQQVCNYVTRAVIKAMQYGKMVFCYFLW